MNTKTPQKKEQPPAKAKSTQTEAPKRSSKWRLRIILLILITIATSLAILNWIPEPIHASQNDPDTIKNNQSTSMPLLKKHSNGADTHTAQETDMSPPSGSDDAITQREHIAQMAEQQAHNAIHMAEAMDAIDQINQAIVSMRISYQQLSNQQDVTSADAWLKLAIQPIKRAKLIDEAENKLLGEIATLRQEIANVQKTDLKATQTQLQNLQISIHELSAPIQVTKTDHDHASDTKTEHPEEQTGFWKHWQQSITQQLDAIYHWAINSIQIDTIDHAQYQTFKHTLSAQFFHNEMQLLIEQASIAAAYHDQRSFDYLCAQIKSQILFHIQETKLQNRLVGMVDQARQLPVAIKLPDYLPLIQSCQDVLQQLHPDNLTPPASKTNGHERIDNTSIPEPSTPLETQLQHPPNEESLSFLNVQAAIT